MRYAGKILKNESEKKSIKSHFQKKTIAKIVSLRVHRKDIRKQTLKKFSFSREKFFTKSYATDSINGFTQERHQKLNSEAKKTHFRYYISSTKNSSKDRISDSTQK